MAKPTGNVQVDIDTLFTALLGLTAPGGVAPVGTVTVYQTPALATPYTPDPSLGEIIEMTPALQGGITVNPPARADGVAIVKGAFLLFKWVQDGTGGRVVTYSGAAGGFKTGGAVAFATTLSTITWDYFVYDGSFWRIWQRITGQAI